MKPETAEKITESLRRGYNTIAADFMASRQDMDWPEIAPFARYLASGQRVLDLGCGSGRGYRLVADRAIEYEGLDISEELIALAKRRNRDLLAGFRVGSMRALPYEDRSFDAVLAIASLHHLPSAMWRRQALREMQRVLKPGGYLLMTNWYLWQGRRWRWFWRSLPGKISGRSGLDWKDVIIPWRKQGKVMAERFYHGFTAGELRRLCQQAGLAVVSNRKSDHCRRGGDRNLVTVCQRPAKD